MFKESESYFQDKYFVCSDDEFVNVIEQRRILNSFEETLGVEKSEEFWKKLGENEQLLYWMEKAISCFNTTSSSELPIDRNDLLSFWENSIQEPISSRCNQQLNTLALECKPENVDAIWSMEGLPVPNLLYLSLDDDLNNLQGDACRVSSGLEFLRYILRSSPKMFDMSRREEAVNVLMSLATKNLQFRLVCSQIFELLDYKPPFASGKDNIIEYMRNICYKSIDQNKYHLSQNGKFILLNLIITIGYEYPKEMFDLLANIEKLAHLPYATKKEHSRYHYGGFTAGGIPEPLNHNTSIILNAAFDYINHNSNQIDRNQYLLQYGYQSIKEGSSIDPFSEEPSNCLRFRRQSAADYFLSEIMGSDNSFVSNDIYRAFCKSLFDVDPAVRLTITQIMGGLHRIDALPHLCELLTIENSSNKLKELLQDTIDKIKRING